MLSLKMNELANWLDVKINCAANDQKITGVSTDSRTLEKGDLFVAIAGEHFDGHQFIKDAAAKGAVAALVSKKLDKTLEAISKDSAISLPLIYVEDPLHALGEMARCYRQQFNIPLAAITGSCGKTSVKEMLASVLTTAGPALATRGNLNTEIGVPLTLLRLNSNHQTAVIEMGARKQGDIRYLMNIAMPTVTLITNAGVAHLEVFGSERGIAEAKGEIYAHLHPNGTAIINVDEPHAPYWKGLLKGQRLLTFGFDAKADISCTELEQTAMGSVFKLRTPKGEGKIHLSSPGKHSISNALAVVAVSLAMEIPIEKIKQGLEVFQPVSGRLQTKLGKNGIRVIDDSYNANPASVKAALAVLSAYSNNTVFVMGDMLELGNETAKLHQMMGEEAKRLGIKAMLGTGPLTTHAIQAFGSQARHFSDKKSLIQALDEIVNTGDATILVKGSRGMKMEEVVQALI